MQIRLFPTLIVAAFLCTLPSTTPATQIIFAGSIEGPEVSDWRTPGTAKTYDLDGNNIYGSMGAINWLHGYTGVKSAGSTEFGWAPISWGTVGWGDDYRMIDSIPNSPDDDLATTSQDGFIFQLTGRDSDYLGKTVRVGIMSDVLPGDQWSADRYKAYELKLTVGGTGSSGVIPVRGGGGGNGVPEFYFWDLTGVKAGDQFQLIAWGNVGGISFNPAYAGSVSFDIVPEPSAAWLALGGVTGLLGLRRYRAH